MANFRYYARDAQGESINGTVAASSLDNAGRLLRADGKFIINITRIAENESSGPLLNTPRFSGRVKRREVIFFIQQLAVMLETGVAMSEALDCLVAQCPNPAFGYVLRDVTRQVQAGNDLSGALGRYPKVFPILVIALMRASEVSGTMSTMLQRIADYMTKEQQILRQARGALMYPLFMMCMAVSVTIFLMTFVLPRFAKIYESKNAVLPAPTRLLLGISNNLTHYWYLWLGATLITIIASVVIGRMQRGIRTLDWVKINAPVCRQLFNKLYIARAARTMGTMISAGVSMLDMVAIVKQVTANVYYYELWNKVEAQLTRGAQLSAPLMESALIPASIGQMIHSGEKAGRLGQVMSRIADYTEMEFEQAVKTTTQFIEPLMIMIMGAVIGFVAISLLLPIFSVGRVMAQ